MEVICERCSTAYEFDDALVSERGTTVKCTNCGHQFKIRKAEGIAGPERWVVRTVDGRELEFRALRELQAAIARAQISRDDVLSRGSTRPRRLGSIAELEPFFANVGFGNPLPGTSTSPGIGARSRTPTPAGLGAIGPPPGANHHEGSVAIPLPSAPKSPFEDDETVVRPPLHARPASVPPPPRRTPLPPPMPPPQRDPPGMVVSPRDAPPIPRGGSTPRGLQPGGFGQTLAMGNAQTLPAAIESPYPPGVPMPPPPPLPPPPPAIPYPKTAVAGPEAELRGTANYGTPRDARTSDAQKGIDSRPTSDPRPSSESRYSEVLHGRPSALTPTPSNIRASYTNEEYVEPRFSSLEPPQRSSGVRWIVGLVLAGVVVLGALTVGRKFIAQKTTAATDAASDQRIAALLAGGEKSFAEGDLDAAQEQFDKASALGEKDARVAAAVARLSIVRGDVPWLKTRLLADDDPDKSATKKLLDAAAERAKKAAARAAELAPNEPSSTRAKIDALRLGGDVQGARKLVPGISALAAQPDNALTLASLDLGEEKPDFAPIVERLRTALVAEQNLGRARSMLVYALARSGDTVGAKAELDKLVALTHPHPLTGALRSFLTRSAKSIDVGALPEAGTEVPDDWHEAIKQGNVAKAAGNKKRAEQLLTAAVDKSKKEPEALSALADFKWETGDKAAATDLYKQVVDKGPKSSPFAKHAKERLEAPRESGSSGSRHRDKMPEDVTPPEPHPRVDTSDLPGAKPTPPPSPSPAAPTPAPSSTIPPGVDTSDLPGFK